MWMIKAAGWLALAMVVAGGPALAEGPRPSGRWTLETVGNAPTPPMGWNSWNAFGTDVDEAKVMGAAQALVDSGLARLGYRYVNIDDGWWLKRRAGDGRMVVRTAIFPGAALANGETSFRPFTDRLHAMGLKAGIYTDIGYNSCSQAWGPNNPNLPEGSQAEREVGLMGRAAQDLELYFGDWGFDYIKVDACGLSAFGAQGSGGRQGKYRVVTPLIVDASINRTDIAKVRSLYGEVRDNLRHLRPKGDFVLSLCNWGSANVRAWGKDFGTLWRTSNDIDTTWGRMLHNFDSVATRELYAGPGRWNDPDMLEVGNGQFDENHLTEARSHMSLWAMVSAPLIIGYDLRKAPREILDVLGNPEVVAINQDIAGNQGVLAYTSSDYQIIVKTLGTRGEKAVALVNRTNAPARMTLTAAHLKMDGNAPIVLRDLWARADIGTMTGDRPFDLRPRETILLKANGKPLLASGLYLSEMTGRINVAEDGITALEADPIIHRMIDPYNPSTTSDGTRPVYAGWGGPRADSSPHDQTLRIAGRAFRYGIGALANSRLEVKADGQFTRFIAEVGIDDSTRGKAAAVRFELYGDGKLLTASKPMRFGQQAAVLEGAIAGVRTIELIVRQRGRDSAALVAAWGNARLE
jgi:alpha-galactosidase